MNNSPRPLFLLHQTLQLALCIRACSIFLASAKPRYVHRTARWWSVVQHSRARISTAPEPMAENFRPPQPTLDIVHGDLSLVCGYSAMETHFMMLLTDSSCADVASRGSLELGSECCNWGQTMFARYTLQQSLVSFCELVWLTTLRLSHSCS